MQKGAQTKGAISFKDVRKTYKDTEVIHGINLDIRPGEFVVLVGPSGCGKSTTLRMIAGLEEISAGDLFIDEKRVNDLAPKDRDIAMVFQNYALYPHMNVFDNMAFALKLKGEPKTTIEKKVRETAQSLGLESYLDRKPGQLSGGQRQRVAMGRAIVRNPSAFLFDEPLSNLDANLRTQMRAEIKKLHLKMGVTIVYVTHDQIEAMTLADRIVIMREGKIEQVGAPLDVYHKPNSTFVASFMGSPPMSLVKQVKSETDLTLFGIRAEDVVIKNQKGAQSSSTGELCRMEIEVELLETLGARTLVHGQFKGQRISAWSTDLRPAGIGEKVLFEVPWEKIVQFDGSSGKALRA